VVVSALLALGGVALTSAVASASTIGSCSSQGEFAICAASGTANEPLVITVTITASPNQTVDANWAMGCSVGFSSGGSSGSFTAATPTTRTLKLPFAHPDSCDVTAGGGLLNGSGSIHVSIASSSTLPPPAVHAVKGYDGKCVNDLGDSSAKGTKVVLWSCAKDAAENWSFNGSGQLTHGGECVNDAGNAGNGGKVILYTCAKAENDRWTHNSRGEYVLESHSGKLCLTDPGQSTKNGTQLTVATCKNTADQHWTLP
jgi:Ricin-type beta-trefoil lectin domain